MPNALNKGAGSEASSRPTNPKEAANKGAGSEASLPVILRVLRRAPQAALPNNCAVSRQMGATMQPDFRP